MNCARPIIPGITSDGGYAELMIAEARALTSIPDELTSTEAAPLLCAGITTFNALRNAGLRAGDLVAIQGVGGLGHLGIQFARRMGFRTVALAVETKKEKLAKDLGAHVYIDTGAKMPWRFCSEWAAPTRSWLLHRGRRDRRPDGWPRGARQAHHCCCAPDPIPINALPLFSVALDLWQFDRQSDR